MDIFMNIALPKFQTLETFMTIETHPCIDAFIEGTFWELYHLHLKSAWEVFSLRQTFETVVHFHPCWCLCFGPNAMTSGVPTWLIISIARQLNGVQCSTARQLLSSKILYINFEKHTHTHPRTSSRISMSCPSKQTIRMELRRGPQGWWLN